MNENLMNENLMNENLMNENIMNENLMNNSLMNTATSILTTRNHRGRRHSKITVHHLWSKAFKLVLSGF